MLARQSKLHDVGGSARPEQSRGTHTPVLLDEVLVLLDPKPGMQVVDATIGGGGHSAALLERTAPDGRLLGIDLDPLALETAGRTLADYGSRTTLVNQPFDNLSTILHDAHFPHPDRILADCGLSSLELGDPSRGFSFQLTGSPLDMRFDPSHGGRTAAELLNQASSDELTRIIKDYGEERNARAIVATIVARRRTTPFATTDDLAQAVLDAHHGPYRRIHPATRTFQALRIAVNDELGRLERFLPQAVSALGPGGRLAVIAFHSLEDRIVKHFFRDQARNGTVDILTKHPATPSFAEITTNPRSRSAKLRVVVRKSDQ